MAGNFINLGLLCRSFHSSTISYASTLHKTFRKMMNANAPKKRKFNYQEAPILQGFDKSHTSTGGSKVSSTTRRAPMLNKMFMRHITDFMVNGEQWEQYANVGLEITRVQVSPDYKTLNVFWVTKESNMDSLISSFLIDTAFSLRHELSQLRVMGAVPHIAFVKDKQQSQIIDLDKRLGLADYGEDYEPTSITRIRHQLELYCPLEEKIKVQLEKLEDVEENDDEFSNDLPEMPQNVLGLNHADIMNRVKAHKVKSGLRPASSSHQDSLQKSVACEEDNISTREAFKIFLKKREIINQKMRKEEKNYNPDMEYIKQELKEWSSLDHYDNIENNLDTFEDFIDEDAEKN